MWLNQVLVEPLLEELLKERKFDPHIFQGDTKNKF
jgi:hypothetical protein